MKTPVSIAVAAVMFLAAAPALAAGSQAPRLHDPRSLPAEAYHGGAARQGAQPPATHARREPAPAGMPSFHQPSYSIDRKEWWLPHPYFQPNHQGYGYPSRPVTPQHPGHQRYGR